MDVDRSGVEKKTLGDVKAKELRIQHNACGHLLRQ